MKVTITPSGAESLLDTAKDKEVDENHPKYRMLKRAVKMVLK